MPRGPKPTPKSDPKNPTTLKAPPGMTKEALAEWKRVVSLLAARRILTQDDIQALYVLCTSYAAYREAQKYIDKHGTVIKSSTGTPIKNPYLAVLKESWDRIRVLLPEFGLTPSARARLKLDVQKDDDDDGFNDL